MNVGKNRGSQRKDMYLGNTGQKRFCRTERKCEKSQKLRGKHPLMMLTSDSVRERTNPFSIIFYYLIFFLFYTRLFIFCVLLFAIMKIMSFPHQSTIQKPVKYHPRLNMRRRMCYTSLSVYALFEVKPLVVSWLKPSFKFQSA